MKMEKTYTVLKDQKEQEHAEVSYWQSASVSERLAMITYLRECVYGPEATTGRLQRVYTYRRFNLEDLI